MATDRTILELGLKDEGRLVSSEDFADAYATFTKRKDGALKVIVRPHENGAR